MRNCRSTVGVEGSLDRSQYSYTVLESIERATGDSKVSGRECPLETVSILLLLSYISSRFLLCALVDL